MSLSSEDVKKIAKLARLEIQDQDCQRFAKQMSQILGHIEKLSELDTEGVKATTHNQSEGTPLREDIARVDPTHEKIISQAPDSDAPLFKVPKVIA